MSNFYTLNNGHLIFKYGFSNLLQILKDKYVNYEDNYLKIKHVESYIDGIVRFDFIVLDEEVKTKIKDIEIKLTPKLQKEIFEVYASKFEKSLLDFTTEKLNELKKEMESKEEGIEYNIFPSQISMFQYLKNSGILRLEILL